MAPSQRLKNLSNQKKQLDLIDIKSQAVAASPVATEAKSVMPPPPPPNPFLSTAVSTETAATTTLASTSASAQVSAPLPSPISATTAASVAPTASAEEILQELGSSSVAATTLPSPLSATASPAGVTETGLSSTLGNPERNLESSDELVKSLLEETTEPLIPVEPYRPGKRSPWLTPLNLGFLLLMLVGSLGIGYAIVNPSVLAPLKTLRERLLPSDTTTATDNGTPTANADGSFDPLGPDLSQREFVDLSIDNLSTLKVDNGPVVGSTPTTVPASGVTVPGQPSQPNPTTLPAVPNAAPTVPAPTEQPGSVLPGTSNPAQTPLSPATGATPAPPVQPSPVGANYYVVTSFTGDESLIKVRETVSDAFVRNFKDGTRIQLASFTNAAAAQQHAQNLQQRGVAAQMYGPTDE
jgi:hypothetical protein